MKDGDLAAETHLYAHTELRQRATAQAKREDRSFASLIRVAVREYLERHEPNNKEGGA